MSEFEEQLRRYADAAERTVEPVTVGDVVERDFVRRPHRAARLIALAAVVVAAVAIGAVVTRDDSTPAIAASDTSAALTPETAAPEADSTTCEPADELLIEFTELPDGWTVETTTQADGQPAWQLVNGQQVIDILPTLEISGQDGAAVAFVLNPGTVIPFGEGETLTFSIDELGHQVCGYTLIARGDAMDSFFDVLRGIQVRGVSITVETTVPE